MESKRTAYLVVPPTGLYIREDRCQTPIKDLKTVALRPPIDLMYAAAAFERGGCECTLTDYPAEGLGWTDLEHRLASLQPDFMIISITTPSLKDDLHVAEVSKRISPSTVVIAKGAHFNTLDVETLQKYPHLDAVLRGEYESACEALARGTAFSAVAGLTWRNSSGAIHRSEDAGFEEDLDRLPFPARHLVRNELYIRPDTGEVQTTVVTNRGCPFECVFCLAPQVAGKKNRYRGVDNVVDELEQCVNKFNIRNFLFRSDLFTQNRDWVSRLCKSILDRNLDIQWACNSRVDTLDPETLAAMKRAGCWLIAFGVEAGDDELLRRMNKRADTAKAREAIRLTRRAGIRSSVYMLMGMPWETEETIQRNVAFFRELDADYTEIFYVYPFPGTKLHETAVREGLLHPGEIPAEAYGEPAMPSLYLSKAELAHWRRKALRKILLRPRYIARTLWKCRSPRELVNYVRFGWRQLADLLRGD
jgi:radical SAM superfamily enzyme YgiQ (UPF0313 family)